MDNRQTADRCHCLQHSVELRVVEEEALVGQVEFEAGRTRRHDLRQRVQRLWMSGVPGRDGCMETIIYCHAAVGLGAALLQCVQ